MCPSVCRSTQALTASTAAGASVRKSTVRTPVPNGSFLNGITRQRTIGLLRAEGSPVRIPSVEGLIRNRYTGRTFIDGAASRRAKAETKYTPLREVLEGKRVILVEDSIVRSTTMKVLLGRMRSLCLAREIHVRIACPPIVAPCFYGIDTPERDKLLASRYDVAGMAKFIGVDGPRWFLRGVVAGAALVDPLAAGNMDDLFRSLIVDRGDSPIPPRELLQLQFPPGAIAPPKAM